jgi:hypothetical protein
LNRVCNIAIGMLRAAAAPRPHFEPIRLDKGLGLTIA